MLPGTGVRTGAPWVPWAPWAPRASLRLRAPDLRSATRRRARGVATLCSEAPLAQAQSQSCSVHTATMTLLPTSGPAPALPMAPLGPGHASDKQVPSPLGSLEDALRLSLGYVVLVSVGNPSVPLRETLTFPHLGWASTHMTELSSVTIRGKAD